MSARESPISIMQFTGPALAVVAARKLREQNTRMERREACAIIAKELLELAHDSHTQDKEKRERLVVDRLCALSAAFEGAK